MAGLTQNLKAANYIVQIIDLTIKTLNAAYRYAASPLNMSIAYLVEVNCHGYRVEAAPLFGHRRGIKGPASVYLINPDLPLGKLLLLIRTGKGRTGDGKMQGPLGPPHFHTHTSVECKARSAAAVQPKSRTRVQGEIDMALPVWTGQNGTPTSQRPACIGHFTCRLHAATAIFCGW